MREREREGTRPGDFWANPTAGHGARPAEFSAAERRKIFLHMVIAELEGGLLRYSRRRELQRYAEEIGIPAFDANLLIAEAQHRARRHEPIDIDPNQEYPPGPTLARPTALTAGLWLLSALLFAAVVNAVLLGWFGR